MTSNIQQQIINEFGSKITQETYIKKVGFDLILAERENKITDVDIHDKDNVYNHPPMFYVCKKSF